MSTIDLIRECPLFAGLDAKAVKELAAIANKKEHVAGEILFHEGDAADSLFILVKGSVDLIKSSPDGREQLVRSVEDGEIFAEAVMFSGESYPATAIVRTRSKLLIITKRMFVKLVRAHPEISMVMIGTMSKLLRHLNALVNELSLDSVKSRLAKYLIERASRGGCDTFEIGMTKKELAFKLGTVPETLSRMLANLMRDGFIDMRKKIIIIKDVNGLKEIVA